MTWIFISGNCYAQAPPWLPAINHGKPVRELRHEHFSIVPDSLPDINPDSLFLARTGDTVSTGAKVILYAQGGTAAGHLVNWKREGWWNFYRDDTARYSRGDYSDGIILERREYDFKGQLVADIMVPDQGATFPGGSRGWSEFARKGIVAHMAKIQESDANGTVEVGFWVDTTGVVSQVTVLWPSGTALDNIALDIVNNSPTWKPATTGGIPVRDYIRNKITFRMQPH